MLAPYMAQLLLQLVNLLLELLHLSSINAQAATHAVKSGIG